MAVRLQDIASDLNLSKMTISKVLRGQTDVSAETKARVLRRAQELNYRPNATARSLRTGHTSSAGLVVGSLAHPSVARIVAGLNEVLREANYGLVISSADCWPEMFAREAELHLSRQVDVLFLFRDQGVVPSVELPAGQEAPRIYLGQRDETAAGVHLGVRDEDIGRVSARHLVQSGCKRIACLRGPRTAGYDERFAGFLRVLRRAEINLRQEWVIQAEIAVGERAGQEYRNALQAGRKLFAGGLAPDGVATCSDLQACGVRDAALEAGLRVPEQVQVLGSGNQADLCEMGTGLSSVDYALEETGQRAARLGLALIARHAGQADVHGALMPKVVQRGSTLGARAGARGGVQRVRTDVQARAGAGGR